jgi:hypothetical protein
VVDPAVFEGITGSISNSGQAEINIRRATARLMIDFGTPVTKIDSPRGESHEVF